jgi:hypothetical protein
MRAADSAIPLLLTRYRPIGSRPRAAGWSAATLCFGPFRRLAPHAIIVTIGVSRPCKWLSLATIMTLMTHSGHWAPNFAVLHHGACVPMMW